MQMLLQKNDKHHRGDYTQGTKQTSGVISFLRAEKKAAEHVKRFFFLSLWVGLRRWDSVEGAGALAGQSPGFKSCLGHGLGV